MKKIIPILILCMFLFCGLQSVVSHERIDNGFSLNSDDYKIHIAPIINPDLQNYQIINDNGKQTNEELKIYTVSYKTNSNDIEYYKKIKDEMSK